MLDNFAIEAAKEMEVSETDPLARRRYPKELALVRCGRRVPHGNEVALGEDALDGGTQIRKRHADHFHELSETFGAILFAGDLFMPPVNKLSGKDFRGNIKVPPIEHLLDDLTPCCARRSQHCPLASLPHRAPLPTIRIDGEPRPLLSF